MVGGDRRHPTPVVDTGVEQDAEVVAQIRWCLEVDVVRQDHAGQRDGVEVVVVGARRCVVHRGAVLRKEVLDDHLLHVPVTRVGGGDGLERGDAVVAVLADSDEDAGGERDRQLARGFERRQPAVGCLVR